MAGGEGTRLRPLTETMPKPLVPIAGRAAMTHILELLALHGFTEAIVTTMYLGDKLSEYYGESYNGISLKYIKEDKPRGTAGCVKGAEEYIGGDFIVISGDAVCDADLSDAVRYHREKNAEITIVTSHVSEPLEYGVLMCDQNGKITRFIEKPAWSNAFSDRVNTGIYIISGNVLNEIPSGIFYDFSRDLFPKMLSAGRGLYAYDAYGYWCDIGDLQSFYRCNFEMCDGEPLNIIGKNCNIAENASVRSCVIFDGVTIGASSVAIGAIICENVTIGNGVIIRPGCVIGADTVIEDNASIKSNIKIWNNKHIKKGMSVMRNLVFGEARDERELFCDGGIIGDIGVITADYAIRLGHAVACAAGDNACAGIIAYDSGTCDLISSSIVSGMLSSGCDVYDFGHGFESMAAFAAVKYGMSVMLCISKNSEGKIKISMYDACGLYPTRLFERSLTAALAKCGETISEKLGICRKISGLDILYIAEMQNYSCGATNCMPLKGMNLSLCDSVPAKILAAALIKMGADVKIGKMESNAELYLCITDDGSDIKITENHISYSYDADMWHIAAIIENAHEDNSGDKYIALPYTAPRILSDIASKMNIEVLNYSGTPHDHGEDGVRRRAAGQLWLRDACMAAVKILVLINCGKISLHDLAQNIPSFNVRRENYELDGSCDIGRAKTLILTSLGSGNTNAPSEGVTIEYRSRGLVRVIPSRHNSLTMIADAETAECAEEIMHLSRKKISEILDERIK